MTKAVLRVLRFMETVAELQPEHLNVIAEIGAVHNSIGSDAFVADEIITYNGKRVRIGNTDAEGRLIMADLLSHLREGPQADGEHELYTVATLTGHAACQRTIQYVVLMVTLAVITGRVI